MEALKKCNLISLCKYLSALMKHGGTQEMQCYFTLQIFECFDIPIEELWAEFDVLDGMRMHSRFCRHSLLRITNTSITDEEFFTWLSKVVCLMGALTVSRICLLMQLKSFYVRLISLQEGLVRKLSLQSFRVTNACHSATFSALSGIFISVATC